MSTRFAFAEAAASGTLMGFGFGAFGSAVSYKNTAQTGKALNGAGLGDALIALGKTMDSGSAAQVFAQELSGKGKVSNADVGKLYGLITEQAKDMTPAQIFAKAIEARASTQEAPVELTPEQIRDQELVDMSREASRLLERKHVVDNAPPDVAPVLENIMNALDEMRVNMPVNAQPTPTAIQQTPSSAVKLDANIHSQQSADTSVSTNQSAVGALHEAPAKESASLAPTDAELNEAFKAGAEGRRYVPKGTATSAPTTMDTTRLAVTPLDVDEKAKTSSSPVANDLNTIKPAEPFQSGVTEIDNAEENNWTEAKANNISKEDKQAIMAYAVSKGVNMVDISKFDGDIELLKSGVDVLSLLIQEYGLTKRKITLSVGEMSDEDFAVTRNNTIIINAKALRSREITEENLQRSPGKFAAKRVEGIVVHEFGHILSSIIGNKGVVIAQQAYYNIYGQNLDFNLMIQYLQDSISEYAVTYLGYGQNQLFDAKKYQEVLPEVIAKHNSNATSFTDEFIRIIKEGVIK